MIEEKIAKLKSFLLMILVVSVLIKKSCYDLFIDDPFVFCKILNFLRN